MGALTLLLAAGCGGDGSPPRLVDGSQAPELPAALAGLDGAVMTRTAVVTAREVDPDELQACGVPEADDAAVVERVGLRGSSLTFAGGGLSMSGCDSIPDPFRDPDRPFGGVWCAVAVGFLRDGRLNDPRLSLCTAEDGDLTAFVWIEPRADARWVVVAEAGRREVYEVAESLPVRVTGTRDVQGTGKASFPIEEYAADGTRLREYVLEAQVAG